MSPKASVATCQLTRAVKNASAKPAAHRRITGFAWNLTAPNGVLEAKVERSMSLRIAVALAATIGAGMLMSSEAEARPDMVGFRGDYSPGTIVVKTNERRLYLVLDDGHAVRYPVGVFVSYGCIRMLNDDITDLYQRVSVGTTVVVSR